ncbi:serine/threonine-protein kinase [Streptomyces avermitilis]|uniref:serine/threonine-protein kinase n=1 Tax=Streptomyces avermitilis TaxID=33903 RepID=UPI00339E5D07
MQRGRVLDGRYLVRRQLGSGFRRVWTAYDEDLQEEVRVEEVGAAHRERTRWVARSLRAAASRLRGHPYVISVYDVVEADGAVWAVMPLVAGPSLADLVADGDQMPAREVWKLVKALLSALDAMHGAGIVHGDVRPASIRLHQSRWVLLPGTGALAWADPDLTPYDMENFAAAYSAPEVLGSYDQWPTPSSDLFSLGATLYHVVAGHAPFYQDNVAETRMAVMTQPPPPLAHAGRLELLIQGLLVKSPELRVDMHEALHVLEGGEVVARPEPYAAWATSAGPATVELDQARAKTADYAFSTVRRVLPTVLAVALMVTSALTLAHVSAADVLDFFVTLLPWVVFVLGACVLAVQACAAVARRSSSEEPLWRVYVRSLAPPEPWNDEERDRRRAAAERAVDEALLTVDRRVAAASQDSGRGTSDV